MRFGFSTMGDPGLSLETAGEVAERFAMDFLELRFLRGSLALPEMFPGTAPIATAAPVQLVASSLQLITATEAEVTGLRDWAALASRMGAPYVRIFGGGTWEAEPTEGELAHAAQMLEMARKVIAEFPCELLLETHSAFCSSARCRRLNERLENPVSILWDSSHTWRMAGEPPAETWRELGPLIRHVHYKDSEEGYKLTLPGRGGYPGRELFALLRRVGFTGSVSLEWERPGHPELPPLEEALVAFREVICAAPQPCGNAGFISQGNRAGAWVEARGTS